MGRSGHRTRPVPAACGPGGCQGGYWAVFQRIEQAARSLRRIHGLAVRRAGLTPAQFQVLTLLRDRNHRPPSEIATLCGCTRATITGVVDGLEKKRLVARTPHPSDRRSALIAITREGRRALDGAPELGRVLANCCSGLSPDEGRRLAEGLARLNESLDRAGRAE